MSDSVLHREKLYRPEINLAEVLRKNASGLFKEKGDLERSLFRALVVGVDTLGGRLETPTGQPEGGESIRETIRDVHGVIIGNPYEVKTKVGPRNPKDSIRAKVIAPNIDTFTSFQQLRTYWPLFPGQHSPSAGELVYVMFEDEEMNNGLWLCEVPNNIVGDNSNTVLMTDLIAGMSEQKSLASKYESIPPPLEEQKFGDMRISDLFK